MRHRLLTLCLCFLLPLPALAAPLAAVLRPAELAGEALVYDVGFLWFDRLAEGRFTFAAGDGPGRWRAELEAKTLGVAGWLTGERRQHYISVMEEGEGGKLRSLYHESLILTDGGRKRTEKRYVFDYQKGEVRYERRKGGETTETAIFPLDRAAPPLDVLTAFVAFRAGQAGALRPGESYLIPTFSHRGVAKIVVETIADSERDRYPFPPHGLLAQVRIDPEVFDTGDGYTYIWFDDRGRPAAGIVENVIGMGNVRGSLRPNP